MSVAFRGKWWWCDFYQQGIRIQKPFDGRDGRPKCGEEHTKKEALRAEALYRTHLESTPEKARLTLREVADRYWLEHGSKFRQAHSEASKLRNLLAILGEHTLFDMIGEPQLRHFIKTRETSHAVRRKRPPTPATINRAIAVYKRLYDRAKKWGIQFPTDSIDFDSLYLSEPKGRTRFLLPEEDAALMAVLAERFPDYVDMVNFAVITGKRVAEIHGLEKTKVDLRGRRASVVQKGGTDLFFRLSDDALEIIRRCWMHHPVYVFTFICRKNYRRVLPDGTVIERLKGQRYPFTRTGWRDEFARCARAAGLKNFRFHDLRHTAATNALEATGNIYAVKELLGHASLSSTMRYAHILDHRAEEAMELGAKYRRGELPRQKSLKKSLQDTPASARKR